jgi:hypothetical protein
LLQQLIAATATTAIRSIFFMSKKILSLKNNVNSPPFCEKRCKITAFFGYMQKKV